MLLAKQLSIYNLIKKLAKNLTKHKKILKAPSARDISPAQLKLNLAALHIS